MSRSLLSLLAVAVVAGAENEPKQWVWFDTRDTERGPRLVLSSPGGETRTLLAAADTVLISYLSWQPWGAHRSLAVSMGDTNRVLVRFDVPEGGVEKAELVLHLNPSKMPPSEAFDLGVYRIREEWTEAETCWDNQPSFDEKPFASVTVKPAEGEIRIDVTEALKKGVPHGIVVRVVKPVGPPPPAKGAPPPRNAGVARVPAQPGAFLLEGFAWAKDPAQAKEQAGKEKKLVLALVRGGFGGEELVFAEEMLLATALQHPEVKALIKERFVPVRVAYLPYLHTFGVEDAKARKDPRDPLPALGTCAADAKVPALVVATGGGKHVATLASIGTYDAWLVHAFLRRSAGAAEKDLPPLLRGQPEKVADGDSTLAGIAKMRLGRYDEAEELLRAETDEARYWLGALLWRKGERDAALALWKAIAPGAPWHDKAKARLLWPERLAMFECLAQPARVSGSTEVRGGAGAVDQAAAYLIAQQRPDGSWTGAQDYAETDAAITALCARALLAHGKGAEAVKRATAWLRGYLAKTDPADANGWSACYTLDLFCDLLRGDPSVKEDVLLAVRFVEGGQGPGGAWSYGRNWGMRWTGGFGGWPKTDQGRYHSMNTGPCLVSLLRARDLGVEVDPAVLDRGKDALLKMRDGAGVYTYTWPEPRNFNEPRLSIGRGPVCEHSLFRLDAVPRKDLEAALGNFMKWRTGLRGTVKLTGSWTPPSCTSAYFYFFAYYHAAEALDLLDDVRSRKALREDLLACVEADGTWVDYEPSGKPYATAMALLVLR